MKYSIYILAIFFLASQVSLSQIKPEDSDGNGYYNVSNLQHLIWISQNEEAWSMKYELDNDIDASATRGMNYYDHDLDKNTPDIAGGWIPIAEKYDPGYKDYVLFTGVFEGNNHKISGLYSYRILSQASGLFGYFGGGAIIRNLTLDDAEIIANQTKGILAVSARSKNIGDTILIENVHTQGKVETVEFGDIGGIMNSCISEDGTIILRNCSSDVEIINSDGGGICNNLNAITEDSNIIVDSVYSKASIIGNANIGGLFGSVSGIDGGIVKITNSSTNSILEGKEKIGGAIGSVNAAVGTVILERIHAETQIEGTSYVGGFGGNFFAQRQNGDLRIKECYSLGSAIGTMNTAGFVGRKASILGAKVSVRDCYSHCDVSGSDSELAGFIASFRTSKEMSEIINCYSTGKVPNTMENGGFYTGRNVTFDNLINESCYWDALSSGTHWGSLATPKSTFEMQKQKTFVGWDFDNVWAIDEFTNGGYPYLKTINITSVDDVELSVEQDIHLYPNPAHSSLNIKLTGISGTASIELISMSGITLLHEQSHLSETSAARLDLSGIPNGIYLLKISIGSQIITRKLSVLS